MPILYFPETEDYGSQIEIRMGTGDILVAFTQNPAENYIGMAFQDMGEPHEIGTGVESRSDLNFDIHKEAVTLILGDVRNAKMLKEFAERAIKFFGDQENEIKN